MRTKKTLLVCLVLAVSVLSLPGLFPGCAKAEPIALADVKSGKYSPQQYLDQLSDRIPEIKQAKSEGLLKGIVFNPADDKFRALLEDLRISRDAVSNSLIILAERKKAGTDFTVLPSFGVIGGGVPVFIVALPDSVESPGTDGDIENQLLHELVHVKDIYYGFSIDALEIKQNAIDKGSVSDEFIRAWGELRAYHLELELIFKDLGAPPDPSNLSQKYSQSYLATVMLGYGAEYRRMAEMASTPLEKAAAAAQTETYRDIKPFVAGKKTEILFDIGDRRIIIGAEKQAD